MEHTWLLSMDDSGLSKYQAARLEPSDGQPNVRTPFGSNLGAGDVEVSTPFGSTSSGAAAVVPPPQGGHDHLPGLIAIF